MAEELVAPDAPNVPQYFGPSTVRMRQENGGVQYDVNVWVGGKGRADDERWGESVQLSMFRHNLAQVSLEWQALSLTGKYQSLLREKYGIEGAKVLSLLLVSAIKGQVTSRHFTVDDFKRASQ